MLGDQLRGAKFAIGELGIGVNVAPPGDYLRFELFCPRVDAASEQRLSRLAFDHVHVELLRTTNRQARKLPC
jgi:hypothetical protein